MKTFEYRGFDASGKARSGLVEALDPKGAREKLTAAGVWPEWVEPAVTSRKSGWFRKDSGFNLEARAAFYQEIAALLRAGLPVVSALDVLIQSPDMGSSRTRIAEIKDRLRDGASLADALASSVPSVSAYETAVIKAGERGAVLDVILDQLAGFLEEQHRLKERIQTAMIYPMIVLCVAIGIAVGLMGFAVPRIAALLTETTRMPLPWLTRGVLAMGHITVVWGIPIIALIAVAAAWCIRRIRRDADWSRQFNRLLFRLPVFGRGYRILVNLRFARTLSLLLKSGVSVIEGMAMAGQATGNRWVGEMINHEVESVRHGDSLARALGRIPSLDASLTNWIQVGEAGGALDRLLDNASKRFQQQWERFIARYLVLLEPILILLIGGFVLIVVLSILLPIIALNKTLI